VTTVAIGQRVLSSAQRRKSGASMLLLPLQSLVLHHAGLDLDRRAVFVMHALKERHRELTEAIVGKPSLVLIIRSAPRDGSMCPGQSRVESRSSATSGWAESAIELPLEQPTKTRPGSQATPHPKCRNDS
jgi:hypothetical protein